MRAEARDADQWALAPLPDLTEQERKDVSLGCYEMLMVLAEAVAQPLPGESPVRQAREALKILDRAAELLKQPTHAIHMRRAAAWNWPETEGAPRASDRSPPASQPSGAFDHFLSGLERYKQGQLRQAISSLRSGPARSSPTISGPNVCWRSAT